MGIFLGILAVIGRILLVILGIVVLLLLLILFVPVRYRAKAAGQGKEIRADATVTWLLHLLSLDISFRKENEETKESAEGDKAVSVRLRIFGIDPEEVKKKRAAGKKSRRKEKKKKEIQKIKEENPEHYEELRAEAKARREAREAAARKREEEAREREERAAAAAREAEQKKQHMRALALRAWRSMNKAYRISRAVFATISKVFNILIDGIVFLAGLPAKAADMIGRIAEKLADIVGRIVRWETFLTDPRVTSAAARLLGDVKRALGHLLPKDMSGEVAFGFSDPGTTGEVLAAVSAFYPKYGGRVRINPDFDGETKLMFDLSMSGRVYLFYILFLVIHVIIDKNIRYAFSWLKQELGGSKASDDT